MFVLLNGMAGRHDCRVWGMNCIAVLKNRSSVCTACQRPFFLFHAPVHHEESRCSGLLFLPGHLLQNMEVLTFLPFQE